MTREQQLERALSDRPIMRFRLRIVSGAAHMHPSGNGDMVLFADYAAVSVENSRLRRTLRDLLMERSLYTEEAARRVLGLCPACGRDREDKCGMCVDAAGERHLERTRETI